MKIRRLNRGEGERERERERERPEMRSKLALFNSG
jgi:hypothetical protein